MSKFVITSLTVGVAMTTLCGCSVTPATSAGKQDQGSSVVTTVKTTSVKSNVAAAKEHPVAVVAKPSHPASPYDIEGYRTFVEDGRLWVFEAGSEDLAMFIEHGEPAKIVVRPGKGPNGMTVKSVDSTIIDAYMAAQ